jgi:hypothetical protein
MILTTAIPIPTQFLFINFSLKINKPKRVDKITIPTLFKVKAVELSIPSVLNNLSKFTIEK